MDGCSPVNFLGVFCFRPGSRENHRAQKGQTHQRCKGRTFPQKCSYLTVSHALRVFVGVGGGGATPLAFTAPRIRRCALGLRLVTLQWRLRVALLSPLTPVVGQLPIVGGGGGLMGLFHFEEHWGGEAVLHGPE